MNSDSGTRTSSRSGFADRLAKAWDAQMAGRPRHERLLIAWGGAVGMVILLIFAVWLPLQEARTRLLRVVALEQKNLAAMQSIQRELKALGAPTEQPMRGAALRETVEASAKKQLNAATLDVRLEGDNVLAIKCSNVRLSKLLPWIDATAQGQRVRLDYVALRAENSMASGELRFRVPEL